MSRRCRQFDPADRSWREHAKTCGVCAEQLAAHRNLVAALGDAPPPRLGPAFTAAVRARAAMSASRDSLEGRAGRRLRTVMLIYWLVAGIASFGVLASLSSLEPAGSILRVSGLVAAGLLLSIPVIILTRRRRLSLAELLVATWW